MKNVRGHEIQCIEVAKVVSANVNKNEDPCYHSWKKVGT